jgi:polysaccharide chain length determinant protein (PEP-CTERM system associated)
VDTAGILRPLLSGLAIDPDLTSGLDLVRQVLLSRGQLEQVARDTGMDATAKTPEQREAMIRSIQARVNIAAGDLRARTSQGQGMYVISFEDHDRQRAIQVVQTMLNRFVENALGDKRTGQEQALAFFDEQIAALDERLRVSEDRLADFKKRNVAVLPGTQGDYYGRMQLETAGLETARTSLGIAESRRREVQRQLDGEEPFLFGIDSGVQAAVAADGGGGDLTYRIQANEKALEELLLRYTDKHPEVVAMRAMNDELKKQRAEELARVRKGQAATGSLASSLKSNPVYQGLELELKRTDVQIAELRQEVSARAARVADLRNKVNTVPEIEAELQQLTRDYEGDRARRQELVDRRATATLSESADRSGTVSFETIEPPDASFDPVAPNRPQLLWMSLIAALGIGSGLAWLFNQLKPVFHSAKALSDITGLPVLASVSRTWQDRHRHARRLELLKFSAAALALLVAFGAVMWLQAFGLQQVRGLLG